MNKNDMVSAIAESSEMSKKDVDKVLKAMVAVMSKELSEGGRIQLPDFGSFKCNERNARTVRNPRTGEQMTSPACKVVKFTPAKSLKECVNK